MTSIYVRLDQLGTWVTPSRGPKSWSGTPFFTLFPHFTHEDETLVRSSLLHFFVCPQNALDPHAFGARGGHVNFLYKGSAKNLYLARSGTKVGDPKSEKSLGRDQQGAARRTRFCGFCAPFPCEFGIEIGTSNDLLPLEIGPTWYFGTPLRDPKVGCPDRPQKSKITREGPTRGREKNPIQRLLCPVSV